MAEGKNKVIFYTDWATIFLKLKKGEAGNLIHHFCKYITDQNPEAPDRITELTFESIKQTLKRDLKAWEKKSQVNSEHAKTRWKKEKMPKDANACERIKPDAKNADSDSVKDSDKDNVINIYKIKVGETFYEKSPSAIVKDYPARFETMLLTTLKGIDTIKLLSDFDKEYSASSFNDTNHLFNALKKTGQKILSPPIKGYSLNQTPPKTISEISRPQ